MEDRKPRAIVGWWTENLVAVIDRMLVDKLDEVYELGGSLLEEIIQTASELMCELILLFLKNDDPLEYHELYSAWGFKYVNPDSLPQAWKAQMQEEKENGYLLMLKTLRKTRQPNIHYLSREEARAHSFE